MAIFQRFPLPQEDKCPIKVTSHRGGYSGSYYYTFTLSDPTGTVMVESIFVEWRMDLVSYREGKEYAICYDSEFDQSKAADAIQFKCVKPCKIRAGYSPYFGSNITYYDEGYVTLNVGKTYSINIMRTYSGSSSNRKYKIYMYVKELETSTNYPIASKKNATSTSGANLASKTIIEIRAI